MDLEPRLEMYSTRHLNRLAEKAGYKQGLVREARKAQRIARIEMRQHRRILILNWAKRITNMRIQIKFVSVDNLKGSGANSGVNLNQV